MRHAQTLCHLKNAKVKRGGPLHPYGHQTGTGGDGTFFYVGQNESVFSSSINNQKRWIFRWITPIRKKLNLCKSIFYLDCLVRAVGLEPTRAYALQILSLICLPFHHARRGDLRVPHPQSYRGDFAETIANPRVQARSGQRSLPCGASGPFGISRNRSESQGLKTSATSSCSRASTSRPRFMSVSARPERTPTCSGFSCRAISRSVRAAS